MIQKSITLVILSFVYSVCWGNSDTTVLRDLSQDWLFYSHSTNSYYPLILRSDFEGNTIHFSLKSTDFPHAYLKMKSTQRVSLFINNELFGLINGELIVSIDSLQSITPSENAYFTIYHSQLNPYLLKTSIINILPSELSSQLYEEQVVISQRRSDLFNNFFITGLIIISAMLSALYNYYPRVLVDFFNTSRAVSFRDTDENLLKSRPLARINVLFYVFLSFLLALLILSILNLAEASYEISIIQFRSYLDALWKWFKLSVIILGLFIMKFVLVSYMTNLFKLNSFQASHYFNYVRISMIIFSLALFLVSISYFGFDIVSPDYYRGLYKMLLVSLVFTSFILFFKLLNAGSYKILHLFSYLCGTEIIPFVIILNLAINQPF